MCCIYNYIIINKQTTLIIITIRLSENRTLKCWFHAYRTPPQIQRRGGGLLKIEPKVPPVQNKRLATCNDIKGTHVHIPSSILHILYLTVVNPPPPCIILYRTQNKIKEHYAGKRRSLVQFAGTMCNIFTPSFVFSSSFLK